MFPFGDSSIKYYSLFSLKTCRKMKKEYIEPAMLLVELKHKHHLLQSSSKNIYNLSDKPLGIFDGDDDTIGDGEEEDII